MRKETSIIAGICFAIASTFNFALYFVRSPDYEIELLRNTSSYVREYDDKNPRKALDYVRTNLDIVAESGKVPEQEMSDLENEISEIQEQIREDTSKSVYQPVFDSVGEKIEDVADNNNGNGLNLIVGAIYGLASVFWVAKSCKDD